MTVFGFDPRTSYTGSSTFWIRQSFFLPRYKTVLSAPRLNDIDVHTVQAHTHTAIIQQRETKQG
jgi:hypothetical protein